MQAEHGRSSPLIRAMHMALLAARAWAHSPGHSRLPLQSRPGVSQDGEAAAGRGSFQAGGGDLLRGCGGNGQHPGCAAQRSMVSARGIGAKGKSSSRFCMLHNESESRHCCIILYFTVQPMACSFLTGNVWQVKRFAGEQPPEVREQA